MCATTQRPGAHLEGETQTEMTRAHVRALLWVGMLAVVVYVTWQARAALLPFAVGALLAYVLTPVVDVMASVVPAKSHRGDVLRRGVAVLVIYLLFAASLFAVGSVVIPVAVDQGVEFVDTLPETFDAAREQGTDWLTQYRERVPDEVQERIDVYTDDASAAVTASVATFARNSIGVLTDTLAFAIGFVVTPFFMFYALRDRHRVGFNFMRAVPSEARADVEHVLLIGDRLLIRFLRGQLLLGVIVGTAVGVGLTLMDVQLSLALGLFAGITELIPILGPWIGAVPGMIIVLATDPEQAVWVALLYFGVQQAENFLLVPRVQGSATEIHPAMVLLLLVVSGAVFGFWGLLVIVPMAAITRELFWYADARLRGLDAESAFAETHVARMVPRNHAPVDVERASS
ncbi:MAG: AI-2E family transporter [Dehalococcoidia bacterium]